MKLNLTATNKQEELILAYLEENASDTLAEKINSGTPFEKDGKPLINKKTLSGFMKYACDEARKLAEKGANSACVDDATVYGWAIHYFEEESIEGTLYTIDGKEYKPAPVQKKNTQKSANKPVIKEKPKQQLQFSLFDKLDATEDKTEETATTVDEETDGSDNFTDEEKEEVFATMHEEETKSKSSPMYQKYLNYQAEQPTAIVAYRLGDFYEVFGDNAVLLADELSLTLTGRDCGLESRVPMIGFPYHAAENYFAKIVKKHDLYIIESDTDKQLIPSVTNAEKQLIDEDTGELFDLTESEMREFDGDIEEPKDVLTEEQAFDRDTVLKLTDILGNIFIVR